MDSLTDVNKLTDWKKVDTRFQATTLPQFSSSLSFPLVFHERFLMSKYCQIMIWNVYGAVRIFQTFFSLYFYFEQTSKFLKQKINFKINWWKPGKTHTNQTQPITWPYSKKNISAKFNDNENKQNRCFLNW